MHGMHKREIESSFDKRWEEIKKKTKSTQSFIVH